jgi:hypothetical protein
VVIVRRIVPLTPKGGLNNFRLVIFTYSEIVLNI